MAFNKKGLGRGLSALIPDAEMDALSDITREAASSAKSSKIDKKKVSSPLLHQSEKTGATTQNRQAEKLPISSSEKKSNGEKGDLQLKIEANAVKESVSGRAEEAKDFLTIAINAVVANPFQPRRTFGAEELTELADSIRLHGILQPILVRPAPSGEKDHYQLVAGERRWRAAQKAGLKEIPAILRPMADQQALELALIENVQRHDISAVDAAIAYQRLAHEFDLSQEQIARRVGKSRSAVANTMRLLDLPEEARKAIETGGMSEGHGRAILLASGEGSRRALLRRVLRDKLSVRETESLARSFSGSDGVTDGKEAAETDKSRVADESVWMKAEKDCAKKLGARVKIKVSNRRSTIQIECGAIDELQRVLALLK